MARGILYLRQANVRFNANGHVLYGEEICDGEVAPKFCQPVKTSDETPFQVIPCDFNRDDLVLNGTFNTEFDWNLGNGWVINTISNNAERAVLTTTGTMSQVLPGLVVGEFLLSSYEIRFTIGAFADNGSGNSLEIRIGGGFIASVTAATLPFPNQEFIINGILFAAPITDLIEFIAGDDVSFNVKDVQVRRANCSLTQLIPFPSFPDGSSGWTFGGSWFASGQMASINKNNSGTLEETISLIPASYYRLQFEIEGIDLTSPGGSDCVVKVGGQTIATFTIGSTAEIKYFNFYLANDTTGKVEFIDTNLGITIDDCTLYQLSAPAYIVEDCDGNLIESFIIPDGESSNNTSVIQFTQDWAGFANGCYQIKVIDTTQTGSELVINGGFAFPIVVWSFGVNWTHLVGAEQAQFSGAHTAPGANVLGQTISIVADKLYLVQYDIVDWVDSSGGVDGSMTTNLGDISVDLITSSFSIGHHAHIVSTKGLTISTITFAIQPGTTNLLVKIDNVSVKELTADVCSECFKVADWLDSTGCEVTKKLTATNNDDAFGYDFTNFDIILAMRVFARKKRETWQQTEFESRHTNTNTRSTNYAESSEVQELLFELHPPYIYNMVQTMSDADVWKIDDIKYTKEDGGIVPDWKEKFLMATASMNVLESSQPNRINDNP